MSGWVIGSGIALVGVLFILWISELEPLGWLFAVCWVVVTLGFTWLIMDDIGDERRWDAECYASGGVEIREYRVDRQSIKLCIGEDRRFLYTDDEEDAEIVG